MLPVTAELTRFINCTSELYRSSKKNSKCTFCLRGKMMQPLRFFQLEMQRLFSWSFERNLSTILFINSDNEFTVLVIFLKQKCQLFAGSGFLNVSHEVQCEDFAVLNGRSFFVIHDSNDKSLSVLGCWLGKRSHIKASLWPLGNCDASLTSQSWK